MKAYLNASAVAKLLGVNRATVTRWVRKGVIKGAIRPENTQQWRIPLEAYDKLIKSYGSTAQVKPTEQGSQT